MDRNKITAEILISMGSMRKLMFKGDHAGKAPLTRAQLSLLMIISDGNKSIKELAECFTITASAAAQLVDGLVKDRMLKREEDKIDRRKVVVSLTAKGKTILNQAKKKRMESLVKIFSSLTDAELEQLRKLQLKIIENLK
ncbi:MAG: transcriptional regulator MarR family [Candidatus Doudnabacteria bacterium]|nr:transcriptional regulator MarR family [Candidatus Doudnabacteria bacterium]